MGRRVQAGPWIALLTVACQGAERAETQSVGAAPPPPQVLLLDRGAFDAYAAGTAAQIDLLRKAIHGGYAVDWRALDSVAAATAGMSVEQFRAMSAAVETALKARLAPTQLGEVRLTVQAESGFAASAPRLDSLRIDLVMLRLRARGLP